MAVEGIDGSEMRLAQAEHDVIKAARALYAAEAYDVLRGNLQPAEKALAEAIEALERVEGE
jgi:hypothetical protein